MKLSGLSGQGATVGGSTGAHLSPATPQMVETGLQTAGIGRYRFRQCGFSPRYPSAQDARDYRRALRPQLSDSRQLFQWHKPGQRVYLQGLSCPVTIAWFYLKRNGEQKRSKRYVLSTAPPESEHHCLVGSSSMAN
jgi:hypothetical protein